MRRTARMRDAVGAALICCAVLGAGGCSLGPEDLPSVRAGIDDGYEITIRFDGVMNLPSGAEVTLDGYQVGVVRSVEVTDTAAVVTVRVRAGTDVPVEVRAVIRQNTLLGDTYIALLRDGNDTRTAYLGPGGVVPVERTTAPPQLEDTMAVLAYFVNGGSIRKVQDTMGTVDSVLPALPQVRNLAAVVATDLDDLARDTDEIDRLLTGANATAVAVGDRSDVLALMFAPADSHTGAYYWQRWAVSIVSYVSLVLPSIGSIFEGGLWLVPMLDALADTGAVIRGVWDQAPSTSAKLAHFLRMNVLPFLARPGVDITSVESADGVRLVADMERVLRMLGAVK
ncbi:MlaD family protein [Nocardia bovistercoris]|uniref:MCE family protein n=1 Tax=Nocardia bovistercoris TaxID=2785916 RepID=A0A931N334_9NOCA|nr:MlaD family protein [Nocardia bovistercoris]MBH0776706.1 MCE family protein [Nocardia bovistercoris]